MTHSLRLAALIALAAAFAAPAGAQPYRPGNNDRVLERAFDDLGVEYRGGEMRRAAQDAFAEILPRESWTRYRLNEAQARAVAFVALGRLGYEWRIVPPGRPRPQRPGFPGGYGCRDASEQLYELALYIPNRSSMFLSSEEQARVRRDLAAVGRSANECGCRRLADATLAVLRKLNDTSMPDRDETLADVNGLREMADACR